MMERGKDIAIRTLYLATVAAVVTPTAEAVFQMWQNTTPIVEAQTPIPAATTDRQTFQLTNFPAINPCDASPVNFSGTLTVGTLDGKTLDMTRASLHLEGTSLNGVRYLNDSELSIRFDSTLGLNVSNATSRIIAIGSERDFASRFAFVITNNEARAQLNEGWCLGKP